MRIYWIMFIAAFALVLAIMLLACQSETPREEMGKGAPVAAPGGYSDLCKREPDYRLCPH